MEGVALLAAGRTAGQSQARGVETPPVRLAAASPQLVRGCCCCCWVLRVAYTTVKLFQAPSASFFAPLNQRLSPD